MQDRLNDLIKTTTEGLGYQLWGYEYRPHSESALLRIFIEKESGIGVDDCASVSRQVGAVLDVEDIIPVAYILEVSSPGIDRVLFSHEQYEQYLGQQAKIRTRTPVDERRNFRGRLEKVTETHISILVDKQLYEIPFDVVDRTRLVLE
ncbi:MAG: ribosome maturation factor RimP [Cocleimonas sp.]|nr:ribosome maturation factor RimP [Cocleimonas sp.]